VQSTTQLLGAKFVQRDLLAEAVVTLMEKNLDAKVVRDFGREWERFDQSGTSEGELEKQFERYFAVFPWKDLPPNARGFDMGCGSGRWAKFAAERVGELNCIDASDAALAVAKRNLASAPNCNFFVATVGDIPLLDASMDFGYSLGVLHHVPDTEEGIRSCVAKLKKGAPMLLYLYYALDNRPLWFRLLWKLADVIRWPIARAPHAIKRTICDVVALTVYWPLARFALWLERRGMNVSSVPLSAYRKMSFYTMRTDALDRFGTRLEQRFSRKKIEQMMREVGLIDIQFSEEQPFWCACGVKA
jgi:SAM-dependent methyltransferase